MTKEIQNLSSVTSLDADSRIVVDYTAYRGTSNNPAAISVQNFFPFATPEMYGAVGDGIADDLIAFQNLFTASEGKVIVAKKDAIYALSGSITFANKSTFIANNCTIRDLNGTLGNTAFITLGQYAEIQGKLNVNIPTGKVRDRVINTAIGCGWEEIEITSVDQQTNTNLDNLDGALRIVNGQVNAGITTINNYDRAVVIDSVSNVNAKEFRLTSYLRGVYINNTDYVNIGAVNALSRSPTSTGTGVSGENGILAPNNNNLNVDYAYIKDAGEHGIRLSADARNNNFISFGNVIIENPAKNGFRTRTNSAYKTLNLTINNLTVTDAGSGTLGANENALAVDRAEFVSVGNIQFKPKDTASAGYNGISLYGVSHFNVNCLNANDVSNNLIEIVTNGVDDNGNPEVLNSNDIFIKAIGRDVGVNGLYVDYSGGDVSNINVEMQLSENVNDVINFVNTSGGTITRNCYIKAALGDAPSGSNATGSGLSSKVNYEIFQANNDIIYNGFDQTVTKGTFTPVLIGSSVSGSQTYSLQSGQYQRCGNVMKVWGAITLTNKGTISGNIRIGALPANVQSSANFPLSLMGVTRFQNITVVGKYLVLSNLGSSLNQVAITDESGTVITDAELTNTSLLRFEFEYPISGF